MRPTMQVVSTQHIPADFKSYSQVLGEEVRRSEVIDWFRAPLTRLHMPLIACITGSWVMVLIDGQAGHQGIRILPGHSSRPLRFTGS
jgi:hypothetical protein